MLGSLWGFIMLLNARTIFIAVLIIQSSNLLISADQTQLHENAELTVLRGEYQALISNANCYAMFIQNALNNKKPEDVKKQIEIVLNLMQHHQQLYTTKRLAQLIVQQEQINREYAAANKTTNQE